MELAVRQEDRLSTRERNAEATPLTHTGLTVPSKIAEKHASGSLVGAESTAPRVIEVMTEDGCERISFGAFNNTTVEDIKAFLGGLFKVDPSAVELAAKVGAYSRSLRLTELCPSKIWTVGRKTFTPKKHEFKHPILILGGGLGGLWSMKRLLEKGRSDFVCFERHVDYGGHSWITVANKFTKLQTEKGTYFFDYMTEGCTAPDYIGDMKYKTWPTRDQLLTMMRVGAKDLGLYEKARFSTRIEKIKPKGTALKDKVYCCHWVPEDESAGDGGIFMAGAVLAWPGNLCEPNRVDWQGEEEFGAYMEYCSFDKVDYDQAIGREVMLFGHGAFTIENVRTLVEHRCKKVYVVCRKRNLCGMKVVSWIVGYLENPVPGHIMLDMFQEMYDLVGFDVWTAHSVTTDAKHTFAQINSKTVFGVTDVYFLAGYYGLMEVIVDEVKRLSHKTVHLKSGRKIEVEMIVKACGTNGSFKIDRMLGLKQLVGYWVNEDPLMPVSCNGMFVQARNFGSFSSGPGFASIIPSLLWFLDYPEDFEAIKGKCPSRKADERPAYCPNMDHLMPTSMTVGANSPQGLLFETYLAGMRKSASQQFSHPMKGYLAECRAEWENYTKYFRKHGMVDDRPDPPYPYSEEKVLHYFRRVEEALQQQKR